MRNRIGPWETDGCSTVPVHPPQIPRLMAKTLRWSLRAMDVSLAAPSFRLHRGRCGGVRDSLALSLPHRPRCHRLPTPKAGSAHVAVSFPDGSVSLLASPREPFCPSSLLSTRAAANIPEYLLRGVRRHHVASSYLLLLSLANVAFFLLFFSPSTAALWPPWCLDPTYTHASIPVLTTRVRWTRQK
ncbi:hypothetical protein LZ30DRAFT_363228 [Colletotrichum cereale]|nr:hypothetical protein LZ30DRAFT_363228 [Colletotrichum cereale]